MALSETAKVRIGVALLFLAAGTCGAALLADDEALPGHPVTRTTFAPGFCNDFPDECAGDPPEGFLSP